MISRTCCGSRTFPDITFPGMRSSSPTRARRPRKWSSSITRPVEEALATLVGHRGDLRSALRGRPGARSRSSSTGTATSTPRRSTSAPSSTRSARSCPPARTGCSMFSFSACDQPMVVMRISADQDLTDQYDTLERYLKRPIERVAGRGARRAAGCRSRAKCASWSTPDAWLRTASTCSKLRDAARDEQLLGECRRDHRAGPALQRSPDRRVPQRSTTSATCASLRACGSPTSPTSSWSRRRWRWAGISTVGPAVGLDVFKTTQANVVESVDACSRRSSARRRCRSCRASASSSSATRPRASAIRSATCAMRA